MTNVATPMPANNSAHSYESASSPPLPCEITMAGTAPVAPSGISRSPQIVSLMT